ncbi:hypothetical protein HOY80DRAFT_1044856 [Tuber brumale]|nr:hypothetical protein HOY80DRAFT_1044856 [Tuber brumale]
MPAISRHLIRTELPQFNKHEYPENGGAGDSDSNNQVAIVGLVVASLTLLVGIMSLRSSRFRGWVSRLSSSYFVKKNICITRQSRLPTTSPTKDLSSNATSEIQIPARVFIYNDYHNAFLVGAHPNTFPDDHYSISGEDSKALQVERWRNHYGREDPSR